MNKIIQRSRRGFITGLASLIVAPAIVRVESLMPVKVVIPHYPTGVEILARFNAGLADMLAQAEFNIMYGTTYVRTEWIADKLTQTLIDPRDIYLNDK